ncbi:MAG: ATP-binding protein [Candidatus Kapabacteria bacterium]|nr:ATP-binding protein [Candidatus Kapabacteria bacterium]MCS7169847.1 ATP-binding protein [Candidatus Kapabacteria bacterium]MDW7997475.1 ATP-binding protein [Bacteroidota bacterium]MDW8225009.1 ATP-binding protein [Bacteroidota bacterium]
MVHLSVEPERNHEGAWYRFLFEQAAQAWLVVRPETWHVVAASEYAAHFLQMTMDQLVVTPLPGLRRLYKLLQREPQHSVVRAEVVLELPDGRARVVDTQARLASFQGEPYLWALLLESANEHGLAERLVLTDKLALLGQLLVGFAHEIRNPLAAIQLNLHVVQQALGSDPACRSSIEMSLAGAQRIAELLETTLNFARPAAQFVQSYDVHLIIGEALALLRTILYRKNITIQRRYAHRVPLVYGDARQLQQVFINLLSNAADAVGEHGTITIQTEREEADGACYAVVHIEDTGRGIPPEDLPRIFEPFFTRKPHGTGLGLAIARRIVMQHRGELLVRSSPGVGTCCTVRLPSEEKP